MYTQLLTACLIALVGVSSIPVPNNELDIVQVPLSNGKVSVLIASPYWLTDRKANRTVEQDQRNRKMLWNQIATYPHQVKVIGIFGSIFFLFFTVCVFLHKNWVIFDCSSSDLIFYKICENRRLKRVTLLRVPWQVNVRHLSKWKQISMAAVGSCVTLIKSRWIRVWVWAFKCFATLKVHKKTNHCKAKKPNQLVSSRDNLVIWVCWFSWFFCVVCDAD